MFSSTYILTNLPRAINEVVVPIIKTQPNSRLSLFLKKYLTKYSILSLINWLMSTSSKSKLRLHGLAMR